MPVWTGLGADNNWSTVLNWGIDGSGNTGVPTTGTSAFFTGVAPNGNKPCTITSGATCLNLNFTGYTAGVAPNTAVITFTNSLTVRGSITLSAAMGDFAGANGIVLIPTASSSYTSNGKFFDKPLSTNLNTGVPIMTFIDNWRVSSFATNTPGGLNPLSFAGVGIVVEVTGSFTINHPMTSTNTFKLTGTGSTMSGGVNFTGNVNIDVGTGNTLNITSFIFTGASSFKWTSGTVNHTGTITNNANPVSLDLSNVQFNNYSQGGNVTTTLISDANFNNVTLGGGANGTVCTVNGVGFRLKCRGNLVLQQNTGGVSGTGIISCTGTGTITSNNSCTANFEVSSSGIYTLLSSISFGGVSRSVVVAGVLNTGTTTTTFLSGTTISTLGVNWFNVTIPAATTITINQLLSVTGTLAITSGITTFQGTAGWTCGTLTCSTASSTIILQAGITYTTTNNVAMVGTAGTGRIVMKSSAPTVTYAIWTLQNPATQSMIYVSGQGIDSNAGLPIYTIGGDITTSLVPLNWFQYNAPSTVAYTFVN
jgi:hypothetical protein